MRLARTCAFELQSDLFCPKSSVKQWQRAVTERKASLEELRRIWGTVAGSDTLLDDKLAAYSRAARQHLPDVEAAYDCLVQRIAQNGAADYAPAVGDGFPDGVLPATEGHLVRLSALWASGPLIVSFNRGAWCGYCRLELKTLSEAYPAVTALGASAVAIVPESPERARALKDTCGAPFPVLVDRDLGYALSLGLVFWLGDELKDAYLKLGVDLGRFQGNDGWFLPIPATFVVDKDGAVLARFVDPDFRRRMPIHDIVRSLHEPRPARPGDT
ncbi:MAG: AhpC/TSA family protein [Hyphomicrobiaceae bacterium]|nr:MAG: AhpC/TSA family protein [Hyphomicrobiaceae bacterium]